jgi:hypothetical protein
MPITVPNLDDRDFDDLYREVVARVPVHSPEWTNLTEGDPGLTLLQLFTFLADNLSYRSNRIPDATRRTFLTLLGRGLKAATPATGFVTFTVEGTTVTVAEGTVARAGKVPFRTRRTVEVLPVEAHVFWKRPRTDLTPDMLEHLQRLHEPFLGEGGLAQLAFYDPVELPSPTAGVDLPVIDLSDPQAGPVDGALWVALCVTPTAVQAAGNDNAAAVAAAVPLLSGATLTLGVLPGSTPEGRVLDPQRAIGGTPVGAELLVEASAPGSAPTYQRLMITHADEVLDVPGILDVQLPPAGKLTGPWVVDPSTEGTGDFPPLVQDRSLAARIVTWLRVRLPSTGTAAAGPGGAALSWVGINVAAVVQSTKVTNEQVGVANGAPDQRYRTANTPVLLSEPQARPLVEVQGPTGIWEAWALTNSLYASGPDDKAYALEPEAGVLSFGSGLHGFRPPLGAGIRITYEHGGGPGGLVPIDAISKADSLPPGGVTVRNPLATWGGSAGEGLVEAERSIPGWLRHRDRAVTAADFRDIVLRTPGVDLGRVDVLPLFDPRASSPAPDPTDAAGGVTVLVVPRADALAPTPPAAIDPHVLEAVCRWLDPKRLVTTQVFVRGARWVPVVVSVGIVLMPGEVREEVNQRLRTALRDYLSPLTGGLHATDEPEIVVETTGASPSGWPLGVAVRADDVRAAATRVAGVRYVEGVRLAAVRDGVTTSDLDEVGLTGLELPHATVFVTTGPPEDPLALLGDNLPVDVVPVPVVPRSC